MRKYLLWLAVAVTPVCAQTSAPSSTPSSDRTPATATLPAPTIKGHTLGETLQEFVESGVGTSQQVSVCLHSKQPKYMINTPCLGYRDVLNTGHGGFRCKRSSTGDVSDLCFGFDGLVIFEAGKLVELELDLEDTAWSDATADVVTKYGKQDETHTTTMQNGYGATFNYQKAIWAKEAYAIIVAEEPDLFRNRRTQVSIKLIDSKYLGEQAVQEHPKNVLE